MSTINENFLNIHFSYR